MKVRTPLPQAGSLGTFGVRLDQQGGAEIFLDDSLMELARSRLSSAAMLERGRAPWISAE
jgi:hypothetical protein